MFLPHFDESQLGSLDTWTIYGDGNFHSLSANRCTIVGSSIVT